MSALRFRPLRQTRRFRGGLAAATASLVALFVSSCLTPTFEFGEDPSERPLGTGGDELTGGTGGTLGTGATGTGGGTGGGLGGGGAGPIAVDHCLNRKVDADEPSTDCGGLDCPSCGLGKACAIDNDCVNDSCVADKCQDPSCTDKEKNNGETDDDCGGDNCGPCADLDSCRVDEDCASKVCRSATCQIPSCTDKTANGNESDIDCGGGGDDCAPCDPGAICDVDDDCEQPPEAEAFSSCDGNACVLHCGVGVGDCNSKASDGCEINLLTSLSHCGACQAACTPENALGECVAGNCLIDTAAASTTGGCLGTFADCNSLPDDGCEANLKSDAATCGTCDITCSSANGTPSCDQGSCDIACDAEFDDCNGEVVDGCETDLTTSTLHCTACLNACSAATGYTATCNGGCDQVACNAPTDCGGGQPCGACGSDQTCDDLLSTTTDCGGCGISCTPPNATAACANQGGGVYACTVGTCSDSYKDCDANYINGCEIDASTNKLSCGACLATDANPGSGTNCAASETTSGGTLHIAVSSCAAADCAVTACDSGYADCDGVFTNGCEVNLKTDGTNCGGCTTGPSTTWDGGAVCNSAFANATGTCSNGGCVFSGCTGNYEDCNDSVATDGCEVLAQGNTNNCGGCGSLSSQYVCSTNAGTSANTCSGSATSCTPACYNNTGTTGLDYGDCDSEPWDGCETALQSSGSNCGACGNNCTTSMPSSGATAACSSAACAIATCDAGLADCNGTWSDGCEVSTSNTNTSCGGCTSGPTTSWDTGVNCTTSAGTSGIASGATSTVCAQSSCSVVTCSAGNADCDGAFSNGCEVNTTSATTSCGGCTTGPTTAWDTGAVNCTSTMDATGATAQCSGSSCAINTCDAGLADCNGTWSDGCEVDISATTTSCGGCTSGSTTAWDTGAVNCTSTMDATGATAQCSGSSCAINTCDADLADCDGDWDNGCEVNTATSPLHCGGCTSGPTTSWDGGIACANLPHATATGCSVGACTYTCDGTWLNVDGDWSDGCETATLARAGYSGVTSGELTASGITFSYPLVSAAGTYRLLLVGVICKGQNTAMLPDCTMSTATYGTKNLTLLGITGTTDTWASLYYMQESVLATATNSTIALDSGSGWGSVTAQAVEFTGVEQTLPFAIYGGGYLNTDCTSAPTDAAATLSNLPAGSYLYAVAGGFGGATAGTTAAQAPLTNLTASSSYSSAGQTLLFGSGSAANVSGSQTGLTIALTGCYRSALYAAGIKREAD